MSDYAFVATVAYRDDNITQGELNQWFGEGVAEDEIYIVDQYRGLIPENNTSPVSYNAQLWSAVMFFQALWEVLPLGSIGRPVLPRVNNTILLLASETINLVPFYRQTTQVVKFLKEKQDKGVERLVNTATDVCWSNEEA